MKKVLLCLVLLIWTLPLGEMGRGQTAKVIALPADVAAQVKSAYLAKDAAQVQIDKIQKAISETFLKYPDNPSNVFISWPWINGFEFSDDFKYIVPKRAPMFVFSNPNQNWGSGCSYINPVFSTYTDTTSSGESLLSLDSVR